MEPTVFLFDMDGVLVQPGGYRAAVRATVNYFANQLGLNDIAPDDDTVAIFEAEGITCEWDMVPILLAFTLEAAAKAVDGQGQFSLPSFSAAQTWLNAYSLKQLAVDFDPLLRGLGQFVRSGEAPAETLLAAVESGQAQHLFPRLWGQGVLSELLSDTRHLTRSYTTRVFENFALGSDVYGQSTGLSAGISSDSLLVRYDHPLIDPALRDHLCELQAQQGLRISAYTARPSASDGQYAEPLAVFAPEAEMALERVGWPDLMVVGSGQAGEMAWALGISEDRMTKPAPYHAIAAVAAAWTGDRQSALAWTERVFCAFDADHPCGGAARPTLQTGAGRLPEHLNLHIFEDSPAGMRGGLHAAELLAELGLQIKLHLWGVTGHPAKAEALQAVGAQVFLDVNQAVNQALKTL